MNPGPIWPCLALFTPSGEAGNEATVASFGPPLTRTRWATRPWLASSRAARRGITFKSVPFGSISFHSLSSTRGRDARFPSGNEGVSEGEISILWLNLALLAPFTPSGEAGNVATVASFGPTLTPTHCASVALDVATVASLGVARSGETFKTVSFSLIRSHFISSEPSSALPPGGDFCVTAPGGRSSSHPPARYACGGHPHTPGSGASPLCTPPFEGLRKPPL